MTHTFNHNLSLFVLSLSFLSLFRPEKFRGHARAPLGENDFFFGPEKNRVSRAFLLANGLILLPLVATHAQVLCTRYWL